MERFHSRGQYLECNFIAHEKGFNSHMIGLKLQHGRGFIVLGHQYGHRDVT